MPDALFQYGSYAHMRSSCIRRRQKKSIFPVPPSNCVGLSTALRPSLFYDFKCAPRRYLYFCVVYGSPLLSVFRSKILKAKNTEGVRNKEGGCAPKSVKDRINSGCLQEPTYREAAAHGLGGRIGGAVRTSSPAAATAVAVVRERATLAAGSAAAKWVRLVRGGEDWREHRSPWRESRFDGDPANARVE